jgi:hypothetical protein
VKQSVEEIVISIWKRHQWKNKENNSADYSREDGAIWVFVWERKIISWEYYIVYNQVVGMGLKTLRIISAKISRK